MKTFAMRFALSSLLLVAGPARAWDVAYSFTVTNAGTSGVTVNYVTANFFLNGAPYPWNVMSSPVFIPANSVGVIAGDDSWPPGTDGSPARFLIYDPGLGTNVAFGSGAFNGVQTINCSGSVTINRPPVTTGQGINVTVVTLDYSASNPLPVTLTDFESPNLYPAFQLGFGFGLTVCGFGWILRMSRKVLGPDNS